MKRNHFLTKLLSLLLLPSVSAFAVSAFAETPSLPITSGLVLQLDATKISGLANGASVSSWAGTNAGGDTITFSQSTADKQPIYQSSVASLGGLPGLYFDSDYLSCSGSFGITGAADRTVVAVWSDAVNTGKNFQHVLHLGKGVKDQGYGISVNRNTGSGTVSNHYYNSSTSFDSSIKASTTGNMALFFYDGATDRAQVNGWLAGSVAYTSNNIPTTDAVTLIGSRLNPYDEGIKGTIAEVLIYDRALTPAEMRQVTSYLSTKYSLTTGARPAVDFSSAQLQNNFETALPGSWGKTGTVLGIQQETVPGGTNSYYQLVNAVEQRTSLFEKTKNFGQNSVSGSFDLRFSDVESAAQGVSVVLTNAARVNVATDFKTNPTAEVPNYSETFGIGYNVNGKNQVTLHWNGSIINTQEISYYADLTNGDWFNTQFQIDYLADGSGANVSVFLTDSVGSTIGNFTKFVSGMKPYEAQLLVRGCTSEDKSVAADIDNINVLYTTDTTGMVQWTPGSTGAFRSDGAHWDSGYAPQTGKTAIVTAGANVFSGTTIVNDFKTLANIGGSIATGGLEINGAGIVNQNSGSLSVSDTPILVGLSASSKGTLNQVGGSIMAKSGFNVLAGGTATIGSTLSVDANGSAGEDRFLTIGRASASETNCVSVEKGGTLNVTTLYGVRMGHNSNASGELYVAGTAKITGSYLLAGFQGQAKVTVDGGTLSANNTILGDNTGGKPVAAFDVRNGGVLSVGRLSIADKPNATGYVYLSGAGSQIRSDKIWIGGDTECGTTSKATVVQSGASLLTSKTLRTINDSTFTLSDQSYAVISEGAKSLTFDDAFRSKYNAGTLYVGTADTDTGTATFSGGYSYVPNLSILAGSTASLTEGNLNVGGTIDNTAGTFSFTGGTLSAGAISNGLTQAGGTLAPGALDRRGLVTGPSIGTTAITGDYSLTGGAIALEAATARSYDRLTVSGSANFSGTNTLSVSFGANFIPVVGDSLNLLSFGSYSGDLPGLITSANLDTKIWTVDSTNGLTLNYNTANAVTWTGSAGDGNLLNNGNWNAAFDSGKSGLLDGCLGCSLYSKMFKLNDGRTLRIDSGSVILTGGNPDNATIDGGSALTIAKKATVTAKWNIRVGDNLEKDSFETEAGTAVLNILDASTEVNVANWTVAGRTRNGIINIDGGTLNTLGIIAGDLANGTGTINLYEGVVTVDHDTLLGNGENSSGTLNIIGGAYTGKRVVTLGKGSGAVGQLNLAADGTLKAGNAITVNTGSSMLLDGDGYINSDTAQAAIPNTFVVGLTTSSDDTSTNAPNNLLTINAGGTVASAGHDAFVVGYNSGSAGTVAVKGSLTSTDSALVVGKGGTGALNVSDGGTATAKILVVGEQASANGTVSATGAGSQARIEGAATVGVTADSNENKLAVSGGALLTAQSLTINKNGIAQLGADGYAVISRSADGLTFDDSFRSARDAGTLYVGLSGTQTGSVTLADGGRLNVGSALVVSSGSTATLNGKFVLDSDMTKTGYADRIVIGESSNATTNKVTVESGGLLTTNKRLQIGTNAGSYGELFVEGTVNVSNYLILGYKGNGTIVVDGGSLTTNNGIIIGETNSQASGTLIVENGGIVRVGEYIDIGDKPNTSGFVTLRGDGSQIRVVGSDRLLRVGGNESNGNSIGVFNQTDATLTTAKAFSTAATNVQFTLSKDSYMVISDKANNLVFDEAFKTTYQPGVFYVGASKDDAGTATFSHKQSVDKPQYTTHLRGMVVNSGSTANLNARMFIQDSDLDLATTYTSDLAHVGCSGNGQLDIYGTVNTNKAFYLGFYADGNGTVNIDGGKLAATGSHIVIGRLGPGEMNVKNGTVTGKTMILGDARGATADAIGTLNVTGESNVTLTKLDLGDKATAPKGVVNLGVNDDSGKAITVQVNGDILIGNAGTGEMNLAGKANVTATGNIMLAYDSTAANCSLTLSGDSVLTANGKHLIFGRAATATVLQKDNAIVNFDSATGTVCGLGEQGANNATVYTMTGGQFNVNQQPLQGTSNKGFRVMNKSEFKQQGGTVNIGSKSLEEAVDLVLVSSGKYTLTDGTLNVTGTIKKDSGAAFSFDGGTLSAQAIGFSFNQKGGILSPGINWDATEAAIGTTTIQGDYNIEAGQVVLQIDRNNQRDQLKVTGTTTIAEALISGTEPVFVIDLAEGYAPQSGDSFEEILDLGTLGGGLSMDTVLSKIAFDDYRFAAIVSGNKFGLQVNSAAVPEPASWILIVFGFAFVAVRRWRKR